MIKPKYYVKKLVVNNLYPEELNDKKLNDNNNVFFYKGHFRVIIGKDYNNSEITKQFVTNVLDIVNYVWKKEVIELGFKAPRNSNKYYIDIYIANKNAYNPEKGYINISSYYYGYAAAYSNKTPYFVINPNINLNTLKVTIAHEFFHTIQYSYGVDKVNNDIWNKNKWFLEATAVMMEDEVYDNINDYINYLIYYLPYINYSLDYSNGIIEYGKVLFAKFLRNRFGIDFIKFIFENYKNNETLLKAIQKEVTFYNETFDDVMLSYARCLKNIHFCYKDGDKFPNIKTNILPIIKKVGYYGIVLYKGGSNNYLISSTPYYLQSDFKGNTDILENINISGLIFISKRKYLMTDFLKYNNYKGFILKKGWNLIANIFNTNLNFNNFDVKFIWLLRNGKYCAYSNKKSLLDAINKLNYQCDFKFLKPGEGAWVYVDKDKNITLNRYYLIQFDKFKYPIQGFSAVMDTKYINDYNLTIWYYQDKNWSYYSNKDFNYPKLDKLIPSKGYIIKK